MSAARRIRMHQAISEWMRHARVTRAGSVRPLVHAVYLRRVDRPEEETWAVLAEREGTEGVWLVEGIHSAAPGGVLAVSGQQTLKGKGIYMVIPLSEEEIDALPRPPWDHVVPPRGISKEQIAHDLVRGLREGASSPLLYNAGIYLAGGSVTTMEEMILRYQDFTRAFGGRLVASTNRREVGVLLKQARGWRVIRSPDPDSLHVRLGGGEAYQERVDALSTHWLWRTRDLNAGHGLWLEVR